jgi:hypothetical protein
MEDEGSAFLSSDSKNILIIKFVIFHVCCTLVYLFRRSRGTTVARKQLIGDTCMPSLLRQQPLINNKILSKLCIFALLQFE